MKKLTIMIWVMVTTCLPIVGHANTDECGDRNVNGGTIFTLNIDRSFHPNVEFKLCGRKEPGKSFLLITAQREKGSQRSNTRRIALDESTKTNVVSLYENALDYNVKDDAMGLDGSSWCLETTRGFTYSKACFWTPISKSKERGIVNLQVLGTELWRLAEFDLNDLY